MIKVNPPPQIKLPEALAKDKATVTYFRHLDRMLLQLWRRTGGVDDYISESEDGEDNNNQVMYLTAQLNELRNQVIEIANEHHPIIDLSAMLERLNILENHITAVVDLSAIYERIKALEEQ